MKQQWVLLSTVTHFYQHMTSPEERSIDTCSTMLQDYFTQTTLTATVKFCKESLLIFLY